MAQTRNLCAQLPLDLHAKVCGKRERSGLTTAQYITNLLTEYYKREPQAKRLKLYLACAPPERGIIGRIFL